MPSASRHRWLTSELEVVYIPGFWKASQNQLADRSRRRAAGCERKRELQAQQARERKRKLQEKQKAKSSLLLLVHCLPEAALARFPHSPTLALALALALGSWRWSLACSAPSSPEPPALGLGQDLVHHILLGDEVAGLVHQAEQLLDVARPALQSRLREYLQASQKRCAISIITRRNTRRK